MPGWLIWIASGLGWLFKTFINRTPAAVAEGEQLGAAKQKLATAEAQAKTEAAIATAEVAAPATVAATVATLNDGSF